MSKKKRNWGENGFEHWGGYMAAKKAKLQEQFCDTANREFKESSKLFEGVAIFVNGYTNPTSDELRRLMMLHGGIYHHYMRPKVTTHIIATNLPYSKIMLYRKSQNPIPICKPQWITDSIAAGKVLNFQDYILCLRSSGIHPHLGYKLHIKEGKLDIGLAKQAKEDNTKSKALINTVNDENDRNSRSVLKQSTINGASTQNMINTLQSANTKVIAQSTRDAEFLSAFYNNSRLHYIATMGTTFKDYVNELRDKSNEVFPGLEHLIKLKKAKDASVLHGYESDSEDEVICPANKMDHKREIVIMHIDMDCFFVSVGIRNKPELQGLPVAVTHAKGNTFSMNHDGKESGSLSEIASCSYVARKAGIRNGMFLGEAMKMCPNLKTIQYDFEGYKEVSYILYDTVASYTLDIEAVSCDEMYADCTKILKMSGLSPLEFATIIREEIKRKTDCPVSTGFGSNKLQARLATRKAKPDNQFYLNDQNVETYIRTLDVRDLPGVGGTTTRKLHGMNVRTCEELQKLSLGVLQTELGRKMGEQLRKMCRGLDDTKLNLEHVRKSVSAEVNYGIRFQNDNDAIDFLGKLSTEVCNRLTAAHAKGRCITLKLMVREKHAPKETAKFMGHGPCNYITKSKNLITAVDDTDIIRKEVVNIWNQLHLIPEDMRGIGIQISRLEICRAKKSKGDLINFFNKTEKAQTRKLLGNEDSERENRRVLLDLSEEAKADSSKTSLTVESSHPMKIVSDTKINNLLSRSAQYSESAAICDNKQCIATAKTPASTVEIFMVETKNEKFNDRKENDVITHMTKAKDLPKKTDKKTIQKQTSQENFFRHIKPNSGRSSKYEVPRIQDIDMSVLIELPEDIRNEILDECKRKKEQSRLETVADTTNLIDPINKNKRVNLCDEGGIDPQKSCSQIHPDVSSVLTVSDLLSDVQRDMRTKSSTQLHCDVKREANGDRKEKKRSGNLHNLAEQLQETNQSSQMHDNIVNNNVKKTAHKSQGDSIPHAKDQLYKKNDANRIAACQINRIEISHNVTMDKADTFILQNLDILHNNETVDKHQEMLINLVNHLFTLPLQQVKTQIQTWISKSEAVNEVDFLSLATFLSMLPQKKRIEDLHILFKTMHRCAMKTGNCIWHRTYKRTTKHVQHYMQIEYNSNLMVPLIKCSDSRCNNGD